jgi:hypothetical protein
MDCCPGSSRLPGTIEGNAGVTGGASWGPSSRTSRSMVIFCLKRMSHDREQFGGRAHDMILVCSEALVDLFVLGEKGARLAAESVTGGSPFNMATGLACLGCPAAHCTGLSTDRLGRVLTEVYGRAGRRGLPRARATGGRQMHYLSRSEHQADCHRRHRLPGTCRQPATWKPCRSVRQRARTQEQSQWAWSIGTQTSKAYWCG